MGKPPQLHSNCEVIIHPITYLFGKLLVDILGFLRLVSRKSSYHRIQMNERVVHLAIGQ
jgi:hypothetical protein